jgi:hypothetical protein
VAITDPFFLLTPDLKPINGHVEAFGTTILSSERGQLWNLTGSNASDFAFKDFYPGSYASGNESLAYIGNDIIYGRQGRIESVKDTDRFGDSEADDLTKEIKPSIEDYTGWTTIYNSRLNRIYLFPDGVSEVWTMQTAMRKSSTNVLGQATGAVSPWMKWTTNHAMAFQPTFVMPLLDPLDGLEYTIMGDSLGNLYRMEGSGLGGDAGANSIDVVWESKLFDNPIGAQFYNIEGYIKYHKNIAATVVLTFEFGGEMPSNYSLTLNLPELTGIPHFGGDHYFGGDTYFGVPFEDRLTTQRFQVAGQSDDFRVKVEITGDNAFRLNELGLRFEAVTP